MKKLEKEFTGKGQVQGFHFRQIKANEHGFLYEVAQPDTPNPHYEVFQSKVVQPHPKANSHELVELYRKANAFGVWGWSYKNYQSAIKKYSVITDFSIHRKTQTKITQNNGCLLS